METIPRFHLGGGGGGGGKFPFIFPRTYFDLLFSLSSFSPLLSFLQPVLLPTLSSFFPIGLWLLAIFPGKGNIISVKSSNFVRPGQDLQNGTCGSTGGPDVVCVTE